MSNANFFKTYFDQVWRHKKIYDKDYLFAFKNQFSIFNAKTSNF